MTGAPRIRTQCALRSLAVLPLLAATAPVAAADCESDLSGVVRATISGLRAPTGLLVVYLYSDDPADFLQHARAIERIELAVSSVAPVLVCLRAPHPGRYAVSVRHDVDGNRERFDLDDGGGFSRNPPLTLTRLRPRLDQVLIDVPIRGAATGIVLNYRFGLSVRPVRTAVTDPD